MIALLNPASKLHYRHYNIAQLGRTATMQDVISWAAEKVTQWCGFEVSPDDRANVTQDPAFKTGMWGRVRHLARNPARLPNWASPAGDKERFP